MITFHNEKTKDRLLIKIKANLIDYEIVYPSNSININTDEVKEKIPIIVGLGKKETLKIRNHVVASFNDYKKQLKSDLT